ncbi:MAG: PTS sugar transporter subunit IIC [Propionicimonas sp.]|uniref:PTS mannose/fructose/sorbose/N-acetylgalactosamine transporter subunit IIC n=1 Tax=Propionicimonas sp. TaxID=1955623 RepID=UPI003D111E93
MIQAAIAVSIAYFVLTAIDPYFISWQCLTRPIVIAPVTGLLLGDPAQGIIMGAALESIFMGISAIGGQIPADATTASVIAVAYTILTGADTEAGLALALPIGTAMAAVVYSLMTPVWAAFAPHWERLAASGNPRKFNIQVMAISILMALVPTVILFFAVAFGVTGLNNLLAALPSWVMAGLSAAGSMMVGIGFAILISMIWSRTAGAFFFLGYVLVAYLKLDTLPVAILGAVAALTLFFIDKDIIEAKARVQTAQLADTDEEFF